MTGKVIIAGAGPVGLLTALALARQDVPVLVLEAEPALTVDLRAGTFHPPSLEMMAPFGITEEMQKTGIRVPRWQIRDRREGVIVEWDLSMIADLTPYPYRLHLEQHRLTPMWKRIGGGCHLNRKIDDLVRPAGFRIVELKTSYLSGPKAMTFTYQGIACPD